MDIITIFYALTDELGIFGTCYKFVQDLSNNVALESYLINSVTGNFFLHPCLKNEICDIHK